MTVRLLKKSAAVLAVLAACLSGCSFVRRAVAPAGTGGTVIAQWVEVVSDSVNTPTQSNEPVFLARAVVDAPPATATCPAISINGGSGIRMHARETKADPVHFPVLVCEALVPSNASSVAIAGGTAFSFFPIDLQSLANWIYVIGDTGCRDTSDNRCTQAAHWPYPLESWAFPGFAEDIAANGSPTLLVHVGDYLYRQTPSQSGCPKGKPCDTWTNWNADFFVPAATLLGKAPWIFTRGNHEECSSTPLAWGGTGWFLFFDPHSACLSPEVVLPACSGGPSPPDCTQGNAQYPTPYALDVGFQSAGAQSTLRMIVLDSTKASDTSADKTYDPQFETMQSLAAGATQAWVLSHKPLWGIGGFTGSQRHADTRSQGLQQAEKDYPLPNNVQLFLSGHIHTFEVTNVSIPKQTVPAQLVVGGSGVDLVESLGPSQTVHTQIQSSGPFGGNAIAGHIQSNHGYAVLTPGSRGGGGFPWQASYQDKYDDILFSFVIAAPGAAPLDSQR